MVNIHRILCPVDLSEFSRHALDHALALAKWYEAHVTVLYVAGAPPLPPLTGMSADVPILPPLQPDVLADDVRRFCGLVTTAPGGPPAIVVKEGNAAKEIVQEAERADLVVGRGRQAISLDGAHQRRCLARDVLVRRRDAGRAQDRHPVRRATA